MAEYLKIAPDWSRIGSTVKNALDKLQPKAPAPDKKEFLKAKAEAAVADIGTDVSATRWRQVNSNADMELVAVAQSFDKIERLENINKDIEAKRAKGKMDGPFNLDVQLKANQDELKSAHTTLAVHAANFFDAQEVRTLAEDIAKTQHKELPSVPRAQNVQGLLGAEDLIKVYDELAKLKK